MKKRVKKVYENRDCKQCGESYKPNINVQKYCSEKCQIQSRYKEFECEVCDKVFRSKHPDRRFCSQKCVAKNNIKPAEVVELTCAECGKEFTRNKSRVRGGTRGDFCSRDCMTKEMKNTGESHHRWNSEELECTLCGETFMRQANQIERNANSYCSHLCYSHWLSENITGENNWMYRDAGDKDRGDDWKRISEDIRERDNHTCQECGVSPLGRKLDVHHKIPVRFFDNLDDANKDSNLITLCRSCHGKQKSHFWKEVPKEHKQYM